MLSYEKTALKLAAAAVVLWLIFGSQSKKPATQVHQAQPTAPARPPANDDKQLTYMACHAAQEAVKSQLKAPSTADFPDCVFSAHRYKITGNAERTRFGVQGYVNSQNSFGAMTRSRFVVLLDKGPGDGPSAFNPTKVAVE